MPYIDVNASIDLDDVISNLNPWQKEELCQKLIDEGHGQDVEDTSALEDLLKPSTYTERELINLFKQMWENRIHIDQSNVEEITTNLKAKNIL